MQCEIRPRRTSRRVRQRWLQRQEHLEERSLQSIDKKEREQEEQSIRDTKAASERALVKSYGFCADPDKSTDENATSILGQMPAWFYFARPSNTSFHDLKMEGTPKPPNISSLLGLGLKFVPVPSKTAP